MKPDQNNPDAVADPNRTSNEGSSYPSQVFPFGLHADFHPWSRRSGYGDDRVADASGSWSPMRGLLISFWVLLLLIYLALAMHSTRQVGVGEGTIKASATSPGSNSGNILLKVSRVDPATSEREVCGSSGRGCRHRRCLSIAPLKGHPFRDATLIPRTFCFGPPHIRGMSPIEESLNQ